jgi:hypothetical protein
MARTTDVNKGNGEPRRKNQANRPSTYKRGQHLSMTILVT